jgi:hypothetical protein
MLDADMTSGKTAMAPRIIDFEDPIAISCGTRCSLMMNRNGVYWCDRRSYYYGITRLDMSQIPPVLRMYICEHRVPVFRCSGARPENSEWYYYSSDGRAIEAPAYSEYAKYFDRELPHCPLSRFDGLNPPGVILSIGGTESHAMVTTTRGIYAYSMDEKTKKIRKQLLCPL